MFVGGFMSYLHICVCLHIVVYNTYCVVLFSFVCLSLLYPMSPVSLCCVLFVLVFCTLCCQFLCVVFCLSQSFVPYVPSFSVLCFVCLSLLYPMLPVSLCCVLFVLVFYTLCPQFLCVLFVLVFCRQFFWIVTLVFSNVYFIDDL